MKLLALIVFLINHNKGVLKMIDFNDDKLLLVVEIPDFINQPHYIYV